MPRLPIFALFISAICAQSPADLKPPADVDQALRARITEFYQFHVKQQFRQAEALVAEDTKDFFYSRNKPNYLSFEIVSIEYSKNFTMAKATMVTEQYIMMTGFTDKPLKIASLSTWKLEGGKWCWFVDPESLLVTPFGKMSSGAGGTAAPSAIPSVLPTVDSVLKRIKPDKEGLSLKAGETDQVKFTNTAPGQMELIVIGVPEGIEANFDRRQLKANEAAVLTVRAGKDAKSGTVSVRVVPTLEVIAIQTSIK